MSNNDGPDFQIYMAKVYLRESRINTHRATHRKWSFTLLRWAGDCRRRAMAMKQRGPVQPDLLGGEP